MQALIATPETICDTSWYPDSGATNHVTADQDNLMIKTDYQGPDQVHIGNGLGLPIKYVGFSQFPSPLTSQYLTLRNLLHFPKITKNLLSVSKFARDNNVYFEFHPNVCYVKDQVSKTVVLEGKLKDGLYAFQSSQIQHKNPKCLLYIFLLCFLSKTCPIMFL